MRQSLNDSSSSIPPNRRTAACKPTRFIEITMIHFYLDNVLGKGAHFIQERDQFLWGADGSCHLAPQVTTGCAKEDLRRRVQVFASYQLAHDRSGKTEQWEGNLIKQ